MAEDTPIQVPPPEGSTVDVHDTTPDVGTEVQTQNSQLPSQIEPQQPQQEQIKPIEAGTGQGQPPQAQGQPQHHSIFRSIFETLAGPSYSYKINPNTGQQERTENHRSKSQLADSIVAGALTGLFAGAGQKGPGRNLRALGAGGQAAVALKQKENQQAEELGQKDFARKSAIADTNLRQYHLMRQVSMMDADFQQKMVDGNSELVKNVRDAMPGAEEIYDDDPEFFKKAHVTKDNAILTGFEPKTNPDGSPAKGANGEQLFRHKYLIVDPEMTTKANEELIKEFRDNNLPGFTNNDGKPIALPSDPKMRLGMLLNLKAKSDQLKVAQEMYGKADKADQSTDTNPKAPTTNISFKDHPESEPMVDAAADKYGIPKNIARSLVQMESGGNPKAVSPKGAQGVMQLMPATAQSMGVQNPLDAEQNIDGGMKYLKSLVDKNGGDMQKALAQYHGIGSDGNTTDGQYVQAIMKSAGSGGDSVVSKPKTGEHWNNDVYKQMLKSDPTGTLNAITKLSSTPGAHVDEKWASLANNPATQNEAAKIAKLFGGPDALEKMKNDRINTAAATKTAAEEEAKLPGKQKELDMKAEEDRKAESEQRSFLEVPDKFTIPDNLMTMEAPDSKKALANAHVKVPANYDALWKIAHNEATLKTLPQNPRKGTYTMDAQTGLSYINQFINPHYHEADFEAAQQLKKEFASTKQGTAGANILAAGTAANHLDMLTQAADAMKNNDVQSLNRIKKYFNVETGASKEVMFKAIADQVNQEVAKTVAGGTPHEAELAKLADNLSNIQSPEQIEGVIKSYTRLMNGRMNEIGNRAEQYFGSVERKNSVSPQAAKVLGKYGDSVPGYGQPVFINGQLTGFTTDGKKYAYQY